MGLSNSPGIITSGLVFLYDQKNIKSYKGPTIENKTQYLTVSTSSATGQSYIGSTEEAYIPSLGKMLVKTVKIQNDYPTTSGSCCPSPVQYGNGIPVSPSTLYTYLILYKIESGYTNSNYMYRYEYTASGGSYVTEQGVHNDSNRIYLGDGWYYAWGTFTTNASTNWLGYCAAFYYRYSTSYDKFWVAKAAIIQGNWSGLHPKFWPDPNSSRTNTQNIVDLTNNNTITASSLTYASDGTFSFNGSDVLTIPNSSVFNMTEQLSIEAWVKFDGNSDDFIFEKGNVNTQYSLFSHSTDIVFRTFHSGDGSFHTQGPSKTTAGIVNGQWVHIVGSWDGVTKRIYVNGTLKSSVAKTGALVTTSEGSSVGRFGGNTTGYYFNGSIAKVAVYNIGLTESQVLQNFNAQRGIYGL